MNRKYFIFLIIISGIISYSFIQNDIYKNDNSQNDLIIDSKKLDGNNISAWFRNNGSFNRNPSTGNSGFEWPNGSNKVLRYASGLWLGAKVANDTLLAIAEYDYEYLPGYVDASGNPQGKNDPLYRVYKIVKGDSLSKDYLQWPVNQGAYLDSLGKPFLPGAQTIFYSMTDGYPESHGNNAGSTAPLKAQVQATHWCYNDFPATELRNVIFSEFKIINKSSLPWNDAMITMWSDECNAKSIAIGCDSTLNMGFSHYDPETFYYGINPPALSFLLLKGPEIYTGNPNDTVYSFVPGKSKRKIRVGYKELRQSSFHTYINSGSVNGDPVNYREAFRMMNGLWRDGTSWLNPLTSSITKFPYNGDPETGTGWNQFNTIGFGNRRFMINIGKLNIMPGDTQTVVYAQIVSQGINNLNSVTKLKQSALYVKNVFENNFTTVGIKENGLALIPSGFKLEQNYPNPFNPETVIRYSLSENRFVSLKVYDQLGKEVVILFNEKQNAGTYEVDFDGSNLPSGIYFYRLSTGDFAHTKRMILLK